MEEETREIDIDLRKIIYMMRTKIIYILIITVIFGTAAGLYTHFFITPTYSTSISMCVYNNPDRITTDQSASQSDINASQQLVGTYMFALKSNLVLDKVAEDLKLSSGSSIRGSISTEAQDGTFAFTVTVTGQDPKLCADIANSIAKIAPTETVKVVKSGGLAVVDTASVPSSPSSPNLKNNILVGFAIGFGISFAGFFIYEMFDSTITNVKDLERDFKLPILGTVPMLEVVDDPDSDDNAKDIKEKERAGSEKPEKPPKSKHDKHERPPLAEPKRPEAKPSSALLKNIQDMKGESRND